MKQGVLHSNDFGSQSSANPMPNTPLVDLWPLVIEDIVKKNADDSSIQTWLNSLVPHQSSDLCIIMSAPTRFSRDSVRNKFSADILKGWQKYLPQTLSLEIIVGRQKKNHSNRNSISYTF